MEKIKLELNPSDINKVIKKLNRLNKSLQNVNENVVKTLAKEGRDMAELFYDEIDFVKTHPDVKFKIEKKDNGYSIIGEGSGVLYDEFGTGLGATRPHIGTTPEFLRSGYHHWNLPSDVAKEYNNGESYIEGHEAGKFMFNTSEWLRNNYKIIAKQKVDDVLSKH